MSAMIERVAKAIRDTNKNTSSLTFTDLSKAMARAAIQEMEQPNREMYQAAFRALGGPVSDANWKTAWNIWRAMVDAALSGDA